MHLAVPHAKSGHDLDVSFKIPIASLGRRRFEYKTEQTASSYFSYDTDEREGYKCLGLRNGTSWVLLSRHGNWLGLLLARTLGLHFLID